MKFFFCTAGPHYHTVRTYALFSADDSLVTASQLFTLENSVRGNSSPEMTMESDLLMGMFMSLRSKLPKETEKTFSGSPKWGEWGGSPQCCIYRLYLSLESYITWSLTEVRPCSVHGQQFRERAVPPGFSRVVIPECVKLLPSVDGGCVSPVASCPLGVHSRAALEDSTVGDGPGQPQALLFSVRSFMTLSLSPFFRQKSAWCLVFEVVW